MPSISTSITLRFSFMVPTPADVPQQITSPGKRVISCDSLLTS